LLAVVIVKKVVDVGALRGPDLENYLSKSHRNFAVITEFTTMEMFAGNPEKNLRESLSVVSKFLEQVILLKGHEEISKISGRSKGLQKRLEDDGKTRAFMKYCQALFCGKTASHPNLAYDIADKGNVANSWKNRITQKTESVRNGIATLKQRINPDDLRAIRGGKLASPAFTDQLVSDIMGLTALYFRDAVRLQPMPDSDEAVYTFIFRYALCAYALSLKWVIQGGHANAKNETLRNDYIDMTYAAYATLFDGLITRDSKLQELYGIACWILTNVFHIKPASR
jgi:hypothetical protein